MLYNTYLGGGGDDYGRGIALDGAGNAYVTGNTQSGGNATAGAYDTSYNGGNDVFVVKFSGLVELFPGDTNLDGRVDFQGLRCDCRTMADREDPRQGDLTGDGIVNFQDLVQGAQIMARALPQRRWLGPFRLKRRPLRKCNRFAHR